MVTWEEERRCFARRTFPEMRGRREAVPGRQYLPGDVRKKGSIVTGLNTCVVVV
jgi:hypothetical protein